MVLAWSKQVRGKPVQAKVVPTPVAKLEVVQQVVPVVAKTVVIEPDVQVAELPSLRNFSTIEYKDGESVVSTREENDEGDEEEGYVRQG